MTWLENRVLRLFNHSVVFNYSQPHGLQHTRLICPLPSLRDCSNSCPLSWWCHSTISSSVAPSVPALNLSQHQGLFHESSLLIRWPKYWSFSFSISPSNKYSGFISFRIDWCDLLAVKGTLKSLLKHHSQKHQLFDTQPSLWSNSHIHADCWKNHSFDYMVLCQQSNISGF